MRLSIITSSCPLPTGLTQLSLESNELARLPPALAGATALRELDLSHNRRLVLTAAAADWLLGACPHLHAVKFSATAAEDAVKARLQAALAERAPAA